MYDATSGAISDELYALAYDQLRCVVRYIRCSVQGWFHTIDREKNRRMQNSGVFVEANHEEENIYFYGVLIDIIGLKYLGEPIVWLFKCDWWDVSNQKLRIAINEYFIKVNTS